MTLASIWRNYGLSIVLLALFVVSWVLQTWTGWNEFIAEQQTHGEAARWFGSSGYCWTWIARTMENWQSEFLQLLTFVVLTSFLNHHGSPESKDSEMKVERALERIERRLKTMESEVGEAARA